MAVSTSKMTKGDGYLYYRSSFIAPMIVMLDDVFESVSQYVEFFRSRGANVLLTMQPEILIDSYNSNGNTAMYSLDTKMRNVSNKILNRNTFVGAAAGPAIICGLTNDGEDKSIDYCLSLSEHDDIEEANTTIAMLQRNGQKIWRIMKDESVSAVEEHYETYRSDFQNLIKPKLFEKNITAIHKAFGEISNEEDFNLVMPRLAGLFGSDEQIWHNKRDLVLQVAGEDLRDRIEMLRYIKEGLIAAFGLENSDDQREWMYLKAAMLNNRSAWDLLESGKIDDMRLASVYVNRVLG